MAAGRPERARFLRAGKEHPMLARRGLGLVAVVLASGAARSRAEEAYFRASLAELTIAGTLPESQWTSPLKHELRAVQTRSCCRGS
jgi:hypothetical protein